MACVDPGSGSVVAPVPVVAGGGGEGEPAAGIPSPEVSSRVAIGPGEGFRSAPSPDRDSGGEGYPAFPVSETATATDPTEYADAASAPETGGEGGGPPPSGSGEVAAAAAAAAGAAAPGLDLATLEFEEPGETAVAPPDYDYKVQLEIFEGPLDLLLYLIKREEVDIYAISIEKITKQYMAFIDTFRMLNIGLAGEFLVMAANLCYIKSRTLLPKHHQPPEEDAEDEDPRWDLIRQLIEYKKFKDAATFLQRREANQLDTFRHVPEKIDPARTEERPLAEVSIFDLIRAFQAVISRFDDDDAFREIVDERWTVSDKIALLLKTVPPGQSIRFSALFERASGKVEVIVTFLAVLELMKLNHFRVRQDSLLGEIELHRNENS